MSVPEVLNEQQRARVDFATAIVTHGTIPLQPFGVAGLLAIIDDLAARLAAAPGELTEDKWHTVPDGWEVRFEHDCEGNCYEYVPASACPDRKPFLVLAPALPERPQAQEPRREAR